MKRSPKQPPVSGRIGYFPEEAPDPSPEKKKTPLKGRLRSLLTFVCAGVFVVCAVLLIRYFSDIARARNASGELRRTYAGGQTLPQETASPTETPVPEAMEETEETSVIGESEKDHRSPAFHCCICGAVKGMADWSDM